MPAKKKQTQREDEDAILKQFEQEQKAAAAAAAASASKAKATTDGKKAAVAASSSSATPAPGKDSHNHNAPLSLEERKAAHAAHRAEKERELNAEAAKQLEQQLQRKRLQHMFQQMMELQRMQSPILSSPKRDLEVEELPGSAIVGASCTCSAQGWRNHMEDAHIMAPAHDAAAGLALFAVFDGHSGVKAATMCKQLLPIQLDVLRKGATTDLGAAFTDAYQVLDEKMHGKIADDSGCTAVSVAISKTHITCANVGDSRAVLCRAGKAVALSEDHKPEVDAERARIEKAGGTVENNRVNGMLAMSRAMGDYKFKGDAKRPRNEQLVVAVPDIVTVPRTEAEDEFLVVACDGVWDCYENQALVDMVRHLFATERNRATLSAADSNKSVLRRVCEQAVLRCIAPENESKSGPMHPHGTDNVTLIIVDLAKSGK